MDPGVVDPNTPLCAPGSAADLSWAMPGAIGDPSCHPDPSTTELVSSPFGQWMQSSVSSAVKSTSTFWMGVQPPPISSDGVHASGAAGWGISALTWYTVFAAVLGVLFQAGRLAWHAKGEPFRELAGGLLRFMLVSSAGVAVVVAGLAAADGLASWLIDTSTAGAGFGEALTKLMFGPGAPAVDAFAIVLLGVALVASAVLFLVMVARNATLVVLVATLPLSAGAAMIPGHGEWFRKTAGWIFALVCWKPAAALVFSIAFKLIGDQSANPGVAIASGIVLLLTAIVALPVLVRLTAPHTEPVAGGKGVGAAAVGALTTTAMVMR